jgi:hypothetical protein
MKIGGPGKEGTTYTDTRNAFGRLVDKSSHDFQRFVLNPAGKDGREFEESLTVPWFRFFLNAAKGSEIAKETVNGQIYVDLDATRAYIAVSKNLTTKLGIETSASDSDIYAVITACQRVFFSLLSEDRKQVFINKQDEMPFDASQPHEGDARTAVVFIKKSQFLKRLARGYHLGDLFFKQ